MTEKLNIAPVEVKHGEPEPKDGVVAENMRKRFFNLKLPEKSSSTDKKPTRNQKGDPENVEGCLLV